MDFSAIHELQAPQHGRAQPKRLTIFRKHPDIRRWLVRHPGVRPLATCMYSAVLIQKVFRGFILRKYLLDILQDYDPREGKKKAEAKAKAKQVKPSQDKQLAKYLYYLEQRKFKNNYHEMDRDNQNDPYTSAGFAGWCAIKIQSIARMRKARKFFNLSQMLVPQVAVIIIQSWWRAFKEVTKEEYIPEDPIPGNQEVSQKNSPRIIPFEIKCEVSAWQIQRAWRSYCMKRVYWYLRDLIINKFSILQNVKNEKANTISLINPFSLSLASSNYVDLPMPSSLHSMSTSSLLSSSSSTSAMVSPGELLKYIIPKESALLDDIACGLHVRFRLGGMLFPPKIFFKIYTHRPLCDVNSFAPRDYFTDERKTDDILDDSSMDRSPVVTKNLLIHHKSSYVMKNGGTNTMSSQMLELKKRDNKDKEHLLKILHSGKNSSVTNDLNLDSQQGTSSSYTNPVLHTGDNNTAPVHSVNQSMEVTQEYSHIQPIIDNQYPESIKPQTSFSIDQQPSNQVSQPNISTLFLKKTKKKPVEKLSWSLRVGQKFFPAVFKPNYLNENPNEFVDTTNWYQRIERNGWRPIAAAFDISSPESYLNNVDKETGKLNQSMVPPWFLDGKSLNSNSMRYLPNKNNLIFSSFAIRNEKELRAVKLMLLMENNGKLPETYLSKSVPFLHLTDKNSSFHRKRLLDAQKQAKQYIWKNKSEKLTSNVTILAKKKTKKPLWANVVDESNISIENRAKDTAEEFNDLDDLIDWSTALNFEDYHHDWQLIGASLPHANQ